MRPFLTVALLELCLLSCGGTLRAPQIAPATDDSSIQTRVHAALLNDPVVHGNEISVSARQGVVVLTGQVHGDQEANAAIAIARRVEGVKDVRSEMQTNR
jgi:hyperosmotically inducible protein